MIQQRTSRSRSRRSTKGRSNGPANRYMLYMGVILILLGCKYIYQEFVQTPLEEPALEMPTEHPESPAPLTSSNMASPSSDDASSASAKGVAQTQNETLHQGWAELPAEVSDKSLYTTWHMCDDGRRNYTVCFSSEHRCPMWVASPMHPSYKGEASRSDSFIFDPTLPMDVQPLLRRSYGEYTRGHLLGSAERTVSSESNRQTFYASNIAPQLQVGFNAANGAWNNWERFADRQCCPDTLYVVTGCLFEDYTDASGREVKASTTINKNDGEKVGVPTAYYKVLLRTRKGTTGRSVMECKADELQCAAFVVGHYSAKGRKPTAKDIMSVEQLERLTGITFFANVPSAPKERVNAADWGLR